MSTRGAQKAAARPYLRLVASDGRRLDLPPAPLQPETTMYVSFRGLTEAEQRAAIAGFPGGQRFRLVAGTK